MKNANIERLNAWAIDAHILDEAKVEMNNEVREAVEEMQEMAFWRIFPELKGKYDKIKNTWFDAFAYVKDYVFGKETIADIKWDETGVETLNELYIWLKAKKWDKECGRPLEAIIRMDKIAYPEYWAEA